MYVKSLHTVSSLYETVKTKCSRVQSPHDIAIIVDGKIILNLIDDRRTIADIGITEESNDIQIIQKPMFVALLEMVADVGNIENIPWFNQANQCLSDPSANDCGAAFAIQQRLHYDVDGNLIVIDLSHLNLTGTIHLESLPQTVKTLDLSFNDLITPKFPRSRGKSLEKLNIERNNQIQLDTKYVKRIFSRNGSSRTLQLSSNQIFPSIIGLRSKYSRLRHWLYHQQMFDVLVLDGQTIHPNDCNPFYVAMLQFVENVTNKELIPWYQPFTDGKSIRLDEWQHLRVVRSSGGGRGSDTRYSQRSYSFDLSGLGLRGWIGLGSLPRSVRKLNLSNNNLSSISFDGEGRYNLRELNLQNNDCLRINMAEFDEPSALMHRLDRLLISSNQLRIFTSTGFWRPGVVVKQWFRKSHLNEIVVDDLVISRRSAFAV